MAREFGRSQRLGGQIMRLLNEILRHESKDPRLVQSKLKELSTVELPAQGTNISKLRTIVQEKMPAEKIKKYQDLKHQI